MPKVEFYLLPSQDYNAIKPDDVMNLDDLVGYIQQTDIFVVSNDIWEVTDMKGVTVTDFLYGSNQSSLTDYLLEILSKSKQSDITYERIEEDKDIYGYVAISVDDIVSDKAELTVHRAKHIVHDKFIEVNDIVRVKRHYIGMVDNYKDYETWAKDCFPQLIFHDDAFVYAEKLGKCIDSNSELTRHLIVLNDVGATSYKFYQGNEKAVLSEFESGYKIICSGKGSNEKKAFNKEIEWLGVKYTLTCNPHTKLYQTNNDKRIYFCWGRSEIDNHKIIIVRIGNHWE